MKVTVHNIQDDLSINLASVKAVVEALVDFLQIVTPEIIFNFVSKEKISELHKKYFNDPSPTDCITFPIDQNGVDSDGDILGEVFICPMLAMEYAKENKEDPYCETTLYLIHALLHLLGYEDTEEGPRIQMQQKENECQKHLSKENVFLSS